MHLDLPYTQAQQGLSYQWRRVESCPWSPRITSEKPSLWKTVDCLTWNRHLTTSQYRQHPFLLLASRSHCYIWTHSISSWWVYIAFDSTMKRYKEEHYQEQVNSDWFFVNYCHRGNIETNSRLDWLIDILIIHFTDILQVEFKITWILKHVTVMT